MQKRGRSGGKPALFVQDILTKKCSVQKCQLRNFGHGHGHGHARILVLGLGLILGLFLFSIRWKKLYQKSLRIALGKSLGIGRCKFLGVLYLLTYIAMFNDRPTKRTQIAKITLESMSENEAELCQYNQSINNVKCQM